MQLYIFISMAVVLLSTLTLFIIFQKKNLTDLRYRIGLVCSAILAGAGSLLFPGLVTIVSANPALRFFVVFFLSLLIYILALFIVLILVFQFFPKEKVDNLIQKWEEKKQNRKNAKEMKLKRVEAQSTKPENNALQEQAASAEINIQPVAPESTLEIQPDPVTPVKPDMGSDISAETTLQAGSEPALTVESPVIPETQIDFSLDSEVIVADKTTDEDESIIPDKTTDEDELIIPDKTTDEYEVIVPDKTAGGEENTNPIDNAVSSSSDSQENIGSGEKIVDTSDIIDKMGIDMVTDSVYPVLDQQENSLAEIIKKAFLLKQQGDLKEAAVLYMTALDQKPDNETAFWIVLDICAIYKSTGHADLAEDILLTYMDAFEHLMSEEVKEQILQSLY